MKVAIRIELIDDKITKSLPMIIEKTRHPALFSYAPFQFICIGMERKGNYIRTLSDYKEENPDEYQEISEFELIDDGITAIKYGGKSGYIPYQILTKVNFDTEFRKQPLKNVEVIEWD